MEMVNHAQAYAQKGWRVFPVGSDKAPLTRHGFKDASADLRLIEAWWTKYPEAGIGFAIPEGVLVFDIDPRNGGVRGEELPRTKEAGTRSGGAHLYYSVPPDLSFVGQYSEGVDLKAGGKGYTILPPTPGYTWTTPWGMRDLPDDVLDHCTRSARSWADTPGQVRKSGWFDVGSAYGVTVLEDQVNRVRQAENGQRNNTLNRAAYIVALNVWSGDLQEDMAQRELYEAAREAGLEEHEIVATMESAWEAAAQGGRP